MLTKYFTSEKQDVDGSFAKIKSFHAGSSWMALEVPAAIWVAFLNRLPSKVVS